MISRSNQIGWRKALALGSVAVLAACGGGTKKATPTVGERTPVLSRIETGAAVDPALSGVSVIVPPAQVNQSWAQPGGNAGKSTGHLALADNPTQAWTAQIAGGSNKRRLANAPVVAGGRLYAVDTDGVVHAFDEQTGARVWQFQMPSGDGNAATLFGGGVSFDNGRVYATSGGGDVVALDAATGSQIWTVKPAGPLRGAPTLAFNSVLVMTQDNQIYSLGVADGAIQWQESGAGAQAGVFGVAAPAAGQGTVIAGYSSGELAAYRYENGRVLWSDALARTSISTRVGSLTDIDADPIVDQGRVFALGQGGRMAAYELVTGQRLWELNVAGISTPTIAGEWIFALTDDARLLAIARSTGKIRWISQLQQFRDQEDKKGPIFWSGPVLAGNSLWVVSTRGEIHKVSLGEGSSALYRDLGKPVSLAPVVANNTMYVLDDEGTIHAFR
ncbi:PQQ-binding-like beta-propeller repeat protein [Qipengyuania sp. JC766]|uniref:outer membrane protein assembly factor BamB family protein n=1 Tax=Qipengyuania sp. JC766 TaxID=3232139 RepID=UPI00345798F2